MKAQKIVDLLELWSETFHDITLTGGTGYGWTLEIPSIEIDISSESLYDLMDDALSEVKKRVLGDKP